MLFSTEYCIISNIDSEEDYLVKHNCLAPFHELSKTADKSITPQAVELDFV